ncbi:MAG TPA: class I SAM-dependent methyltransferase [Solirubrobacterales bacterium]|jgi:2-polyprenyl-3-methyl-5-hydroxy-6-metoxy-1,4-benzoquinol methylase
MATASDPELAGRREYALMKCVDCGTARTVRPEDVGPPARLYEGGTYAAARPGLDRLLEPLRALVERDKLRFLRGVPAGSRVLEVGAGDGSFVLRLASAGLQARGIEPSEAAAQAAGERGAPVERSTVEELELEPESLDAVVVWHVLEHLHDPAGAVARLAGWVRPGGRVIVACPNLASLQARLGGDRWFHQDVPRHETHFTAAGLASLLERSGLRLQRISHLIVEQNPLGMWQTLLNRVTSRRDVAFRALKRDLDRGPGLGRDLAVTALAGPLLAPFAVALELGAGLAGRGGSVVAVAHRRGEGRSG